MIWIKVSDIFFGVDQIWEISILSKTIFLSYSAWSHSDPLLAVCDTNGPLLIQNNPDDLSSKCDSAFKLT